MKRKLFLLSAMAMVITGAMFWSCQKEEMMNAEDVLLKKGKIASTYVLTSNVEDICDGGDLMLTLTGSGNKQIQILVDDEWVQLALVPKGDDALEATIENIAAGTYNFRHKTATGFSDEISIVIKECDDCESFSYELNQDESYTFTYVPAADLIDAEVVFTFAQAVTVELDGFTSNPNGNVMTASIDLQKCIPITWTVKFTEIRCNGIGQNSINAFTDFKVNNISKKSEGIGNILLQCE